MSSRAGWYFRRKWLVLGTANMKYRRCWQMMCCTCSGRSVWLSPEQRPWVQHRSVAPASMAADSQPRRGIHSPGPHNSYIQHRLIASAGEEEEAVTRRTVYKRQGYMVAVRRSAWSSSGCRGGHFEVCTELPMLG